jgi:ribosomal protein L7Ae-like RNA K-turn-binding protein
VTEGKVRSFIGLAVRGRNVAVGREACKRAVARGELHALLLATDAGRSAARDCGVGHGVRLLQSGLDKRELGALVGRAEVAALGITDAQLAAGLLQCASPVDSTREAPSEQDRDRRG